MVDAGDLKSPGSKCRAGSSPVSSTIFMCAFSSAGRASGF